MGKQAMKTSRRHNPFFKELQGTTDEIIRQVKRLINAGNARRMMIQNKKGKILFQMQLTAGVAGTALLALLAPFISALGVAALVMNDVKVVVEKYPDDQLDKDQYEVEGEIIVEVEGGEESGVEKEMEAEKTVGRDGDE
jgi:hypothetical protein